VKRVILASGPYWVAVLQADGGKRLVVAGMETHPGEFGTLLSNYLVSPVPSTCILLPQNKNDRWRRRLVRRRGGARLMALAAKLHQEHGEAVRRIVTGIELLAGERTAKPALDGKRPGMFSLPDLQAEAWPTPERWHRLETAINICNRHGMKIRKELREFIAQKSLPTYLDDDYNKNKFGVEAANNWRALRLIDWRNHRSELPDHCHATHQMLTELDDRISGEANILRVGPNTSLPPHFDDYDCEVYIHIGLTIPSECGIRVGERAGTWVEGRALAFNPAYLHEVWNHSEQARDVLAIDTWHPDLSGPEIQALQEVRDELEVLRQQRNLKRAV
jgi:hypothetical protein